MSTAYTQLLLFEEPLDVKVKNELKKLKDSNDRSRKCQFAKIGEVKKLCLDLEGRLAIIEKGLCRSTLQIVPECEIIPINEPRETHEGSTIFLNVGNAFDRIHVLCQPCAY